MLPKRVEMIGTNNINLPDINMDTARTIDVALGYANTAVNTVIFRRTSLTTHGNYQYISFYDTTGSDDSGAVYIGKRELWSNNWEIKKTPFIGHSGDAHNSISIAVDGDGYVHLSWDHHNHPLRYAKSLVPGGLNFSNIIPMTSQRESRVTYPEFYNLTNGNLIFIYRDGSSGNGDLMLNQYDTKTKTWSVLSHNLIYVMQYPKIKASPGKSPQVRNTLCLSPKPVQNMRQLYRRTANSLIPPI